MNDKSSETTLDIAEVLEGNEDEVTAQLAKASAADLTALYDAENGALAGAKGRKGVSDAIKAEQDARAELAKESLAAAVEAHEQAGIPLWAFTDREKFEEPGEAQQLRLRVTELEQAITAREEADKNAAPKPKVKKPRKLKVSDKALPSLDALAFADAEGNTLKGLPDLPSHDRYLKKERGGRAYMAEITFPEGNGKAQPLRRVFALDATGKAIAECRLMTPLPVGGAGESKLPAGTLFFDNWPQPEAEG